MDNSDAFRVIEAEIKRNVLIIVLRNIMKYLSIFTAIWNQNRIFLCISK